MIKVGIVGYGNVGRGAEKAIAQNSDMELVAVFTRRNPEDVKASVSVVHMDQLLSFKEKIDVLFLCGGSATDLPIQGPELAKNFNTVDTFDTHAKIPEYFSKMESAARSGDKLAIISTGWDPGLFSLNRLLGDCILPKGNNFTFWGKGVSQGHSDAIRRVPGVKNGIQYTVPIEKAKTAVRNGENPKLSTREKHKRVCYIVLEEGADRVRITEDIISMPNYFADYDTEVNFISEEELKRDHQKMMHGGFVIRTGTTGDNVKQRIEFQLELDSNPEFTANVMIAYGRALNKAFKRGNRGAMSVFEIPFADLSSKSIEELRRDLL